MGGEVSAEKIKVKLVFCDDSKYTEEVRCKGCHALLLKAQMRKSAGAAGGNIGVEIKCRRCGAMNHV